MRLRSPIRITTAMIGRLILSLVIAFGIWAFVTNEREPDITEIQDDVEIEVEGLANNLQIVDPLPDVTVTVKGPRSIVQGIGLDDIQATVDMSGIDGPGASELDVEVSAPDGLRDVDVDPETVTVQIDSVISEVFEITVIEPADPPALLTSIDLSTSTVTLTGVRQNVESVERVELDIVLSGRTESFTYEATPIPVDGDGNPVDTDTVTVEPETVRVSVEFEVGSKSIPVIVQCACQTEEGNIVIRDLLTATAIPPTVRIEGPQPLLDDIEEIRTVPINIEDVEVSKFLTGAVELYILALPDEVTVDTPAVGVYVQVGSSVEEIIEQDIQIINPPPNMLVDVSPGSVSFELEGPAEALATLSDNPPVAIIDLEGYDEGTYTVFPRVVLPPGIRVVNLAPAEVEVTIEPAPAPTPTPSPTPEPAANSTTSSATERRLTGMTTTFSNRFN